jgi:Immunoglobulin domain
MQIMKFLLSCLVMSLVTLTSGCSKTEETPAQNNVNGSAIKGALESAIVSFYNIDTQSQEPSFLAETRTQTGGLFSVNLAPSDNTVLIQVSADSKTRMTCDVTSGCSNAADMLYYEFGEKMPVSSEFQLFGLLSPNLDGTWNANISPLSHLVVATALNLPRGLTRQNVATARAWVEQTFALDANILKTKNIDLTQSAAYENANSSNLAHSVINASFYELVQSDAWLNAALTVNEIPIDYLKQTAARIAQDLLWDNTRLAEAQAASLANIAGTSWTTSANTLEITAPPSNTTVREGEPFFFRIQAQSPRPLAYQWYKDGLEIPGAETAIYGGSLSQKSHAGRYQVRVSDGQNTQYSSNVNLWVNDAQSRLEISSHPSSEALVSGQSAALKVEASGTGSLQYQWQKNGSLLPGERSATLQLTNVEPAHAGQYRAIVSDDTATVYSDFAAVFVTNSIAPLQINEQPTAMTLIAEHEATLYSEIEGGGYIRYQWYKNGEAIDGANSSSLNLEALSAEDEGNYYLVASNSRGTITTEAVPLRVVSTITGLEMLHQPADADLYIGESTTLTAHALGGYSFNYQWYKDGQVLSGATSAHFTLNAQNLSDSGQYVAKISNEFGEVLSSPANVKVSEAPSLALSWGVPNERENGETLLPSEIYGYVIEYGYEPSRLSARQQIIGATVTEHTLTQLRRGTLYLKIATIDSDGVTGRFSNVLSVAIP